MSLNYKKSKNFWINVAKKRNKQCNKNGKLPLNMLKYCMN